MGEALEDYDDTPISKLSKVDRLIVFKAWLKLSRDAFAIQRENEREDLLFQYAENRWPEEAKVARKGRPMISVSLIQGPLQFVYNQAAAAHFGVDLKPISEKAQTKLAETKKGLYERIQRDGMADQARLWAFDRASQAGMGWYRIDTAWDEDSDNPSDQEIVYRRLLFQEMVSPDPAATKPDFSDARFIGVGAHLTCREFKRQYKGAEYANESDFGDINTTEPEWVKVLSGEKAPLVVELFYKEATFEDVELDTQSGHYSRRREHVEVRRAVLTAREILEDEPWLKDSKGHGRQYIPFVPVIAVERQPVDGERRWEGMVRPARQAQLMFDYGNSQAIEDVGAISKAKYLVAEGQIEGHENEWNDANKNAKPYLLYKNTDLEGKPAPPPQLMQVDGTKMQLSLALAQQARELVQTSTQGFEPLETPRRKNEQSGRAIMALEQKADAGRSHHIQNFKDISLPLDARIVLDMMPVVYDRPGRVLHIIGGEDEAKPIMLMRPYVMQNGRPLALNEQDPRSKDAEFINFEDGKYAIVPTMGKAPQTRLAEGQEFMTEVMAAAPEFLMPVMADLAFKYRDEPGAKEIAKRLEKQIRQNASYLFDDKDGQSLQDAQSKLKATEAQLQMLGQKFQEAVKYIETEQAKHQATIAVAQMKEQSSMEIARMNNAAKIEVARISAAKESANQEAEAQEELLATGIKVAAEKEQAALDRHHEREMQHEKLGHEVGMAAAGGKSLTHTKEGGQETGQEQAQEQSQDASREQSSEGSTEPQADGSGE